MFQMSQRLVNRHFSKLDKAHFELSEMVWKTAKRSVCKMELATVSPNQQTEMQPINFVNGDCFQRSDKTNKNAPNYLGRSLSSHRISFKLPFSN